MNCEQGSGPWRFEMTELSLKQSLAMNHSIVYEKFSTNMELMSIGFQIVQIVSTFCKSIYIDFKNGQKQQT